MAHPLRAEPAVVVSLASVGDRIRAQNPDLAAARLRIQEAARPHEPVRPPRESGTRNRHRTQPALPRGEIRSRLHPTLSAHRPAAVGKGCLPHRTQIRRSRGPRSRAPAHRPSPRGGGENPRHPPAPRTAPRAIRRLQRVRGIPIRNRGEGRRLAARCRPGETRSRQPRHGNAPARRRGSRPRRRAEAAVRHAPGRSRSASAAPCRKPRCPAPLPTRRAVPDFQAAKLDALAAAQGVALEQARRYDDVEGGHLRRSRAHRGCSGRLRQRSHHRPAFQNPAAALEQERRRDPGGRRRNNSARKRKPSPSAATSVSKRKPREPRCRNGRK